MYIKKQLFIGLGFFLILGIAITFGLLLGCENTHPEKTPPVAKSPIKVKKENIMTHIGILTSDEFQGRRTGTEGEIETSLYLAQELKKIGIKPMGDKDTYFQTFSIPQTDLKQEENRTVFFIKDHESQLIADNVLGQIVSKKRPRQYVLLSAHLDHLGIWQNELYEGANDNASGVAAVLEIARFLNCQEELPFSIIIAFWSGEEMGLLGSNYFISNPTVELNDIKLAINLDSIGTGIKNNFIVWRAGPAKIIDNLFAECTSWDNFKFISQTSCTNTSDHKAIAKAQIPAITILAEDWLDKNHTPLDTPLILNYSKIKALTECLAKLLSSEKIEKVIGR